MPRLAVVVVSVVLVAAFLLLVQRATSDFIVILGLTALIAIVISALFDAIALVRGTDTIGDGIQKTSRRFVLYRAALALFVGTLLGHFFWPTPP